MTSAITGNTRYATPDLARRAKGDRLAGHHGADQTFADVVLKHDTHAAQLRHLSLRRGRSTHIGPTENAPPVVAGGRFRVSTTSELRSDDVAAE